MIIWLLIGAATLFVAQKVGGKIITLHTRANKRRHSFLIETIAKLLRQELVEYEYRHGRSYEPRAVIVRPHDMPFDPTADHAEDKR